MSGFTPRSACAVLASLLAINVASLSAEIDTPLKPTAARAAEGTGDRFTPVSPVRLLDTRSTTPLGPAGIVDVPITDRNAVPTNATGVVLNVTAVSPTVSTYLQVYPSTSAVVPNVSNVNAPAGSVIPNLVTVRLGSTGAARIRNHLGSTQVVADLFGYYAPDAATTFAPLAPVRILDTRLAGGPLPTDGVRTLQVTGTGPGQVPADATAVVLNVTGVSGTFATYVSVYPADAVSRPVVSNRNLPANRVAPNLVTVQLSSGGAINFYNRAGNTHVIADVAGYYAPRETGSTLVPIDPVRVLDTRIGYGEPFGSVRVGPGGMIDLNIGGQSTAPAHVTAAVANVTGVTPSTSTYVQVFPTPTGGYAHPTVSNLNLVTGEIRANLTAVSLGAGGYVRLRNFVGSLYLLADLAGYFVDPDALDYGSAPPTPTPYGVTCLATMSNYRPVQNTTTSVNVGTVAAHSSLWWRTSRPAR